MSERELVIGLDELNRVELECPKCRIATVYDISSGATIPAICPTSACHSDHITEDLQKQIYSFGQLFSAAKSGKVKIKFRLRES
jgi:hypothetical protein